MTITWEDFSRGFHGGMFVADDINVFDEGDEKCDLSFCIKQFDEHFFLLCIVKDYRYGECVLEVPACLGEDFSQADCAKEFAEYVLSSYIKHQSFKCLPFVEIDHFAFNLL